MKAHGNNLSVIEQNLTYHLRRYLSSNFSKDKIKRWSFIAALSTCLFEASVVTFSLFTPQFMSHLKYSQVEINIISGLMMVGTYLTPPVFGYLSDAHGPALLALLGSILCPGYLLAAFSFEWKLNYVVMALAFFMVGAGTSAAYFCSLLTCAKIYPDRKGLSISLPVTFYGLSSLLLSSLFKLDIFKVKKNVDGVHESHIGVFKVFITLAALYLVIGLLNFVSSVIVTIEREVLFDKLAVGESSSIGGGNSQQEPVSGSNENDNSFYDDQQDEEANEQTSLLNSEFLEPLDHKTKFRRFLQDPTCKLLSLSLLLILGPLELYVNNLGSLGPIVGNGKSDIALQVSLFSVFSTISRLFTGALSDAIGTARTTYFFIIIAITLAFISFTLVSLNFIVLEIISSIIGVAYGTLFTMCPTLVATVWGFSLKFSTNHHFSQDHIA
ncbi:unnamed protein product [Ambrosiozyma monospora]|uniref:Probable transporter MCH1 n=1 Tax=Ambrosiozyma monospora TaxID=43982 RepID=A0A9W6YQI3_AMBMO|nr:unnamed protein product [Ambrosiozyma monospora]